MLNVLIIGPTGYVGSSATQHLYRSGNHQIFGLASTESDGYRLQRDETIPLVGNATDPSSLLSVIRQGKIQIVVDTTSFNDFGTKQKILAAVRSASKVLISESKKSKPEKLGFITISGIWSHGSTEDPNGSFKLGQAGSLLNTNPPAGLLAAKAEYDDSALASTHVLSVAILRPAFIFARGGAAWTRFLAPLVAAQESGSTEPIEVPITPNTFANFVHIDDVGSAVDLAVNKLHVINGTDLEPTFDLVADRFDIIDLLAADARIFGCKGKVVQSASTDKEGTDGGDVFLERIGRSDDMDASKAKLILGWQPKRPGFVAGTNLYANSYLAALKIAEEERAGRRA